MAAGQRRCPAAKAADHEAARWGIRAWMSDRAGKREWLPAYSCRLTVSWMPAPGGSRAVRRRFGLVRGGEATPH